MKRWTILLSGIIVLSFSLSGCAASYEGTGSKDAASAEQLALRTDDPWAAEVDGTTPAQAPTNLTDGVYVGTGKGMDGLITVTLSIDKGKISCLEVTQEGESQSRGGFEAIRDGKIAAMIDAAQGEEIDTISGATITVLGVREAVGDALAQAETGQQSAAAEERDSDEK